MNSKDRPGIVLLNPPARAVAIRDNYCSKISQAAYINHPVDLLFQSGFLKQHFELTVIDAVVEKLSIQTCIDRIVSSGAKKIFSLAGNATWPDDIAFFQTLKSSIPDMTLAVSGDVFLEDPVEIIETHPVINAIILDYTDDGLKNFFLQSDSQYSNVVFRDHRGDIVDHRLPREKNGIMEIPLPDHSLFLDLDYRYPFVRSRKFATVMTEFGCPYNCSFCVMGTLGCKRRPVKDVLDELAELERRGIRDIFFLDQSFGSDKERNMELCQAIEKNFPTLRWLCFSRVDLVNIDILNTMKRAGCHTIIFGVETANPDLLKKYRKGYSLEQVQTIFSLTTELGIRTVATFLLGLPGETRESAIKTIEFASKLPCSYASLNVAVPRMGTEFRQWALDKGLIDPEEKHFDQSGSQVIMETENLSTQELAQLKRIAIRKLYLRPGRILKMLFALKSMDEVLIHLREGFHFLCRFTGLKS